MERYISWRTLEHAARKRQPDWYWAVGIIAISIAATSVLFQNVLFGILVLLSAFSLMLQAAREPKVIDVSLSTDGLRLADERYEFSALESFWIDETNPEDSRLILKAKKLLTPLIVVPIADVPPDEVRNILRSFLPEVETLEPLTQKFMEYLGF